MQHLTTNLKMDIERGHLPLSYFGLHFSSTVLSSPILTYVLLCLS